MDSTSKTTARATVWTKCCLCQQGKEEELKSPHANPSKRGEDGYTALAINVPLFHSLNEMPINLDPVRLDEGDGVEVTLRANNALYHKLFRTWKPTTGL